MKAKLVVVGGDIEASSFEIRLPAVIGRAKNATLSLTQPLISRRHCELYEKNGRLVVRDLGSLNGTFVNNEQIESEHIVEPDQLLTIGTVTLRAQYDVGSCVTRETQADDSAAKRDTVANRASSTDTDLLPVSRPIETETLLAEDLKSNVPEHGNQELAAKAVPIRDPRSNVQPDSRPNPSEKPHSMPKPAFVDHEISADRMSAEFLSQDSRLQ